MVLVSLWATYDLERSLSKLCNLLFGIALYYALVNVLRQERHLWWATGAVLSSGIAVALLGLLGTRWPVGKVSSITSFLGPLYQRLPFLLQGLPRAEEGFSPNQLAGTLILFIPLTVTLCLHRVRVQATARPGAGVILVLGATFTLLMGVVLLTQSRMAYASIALTGLLMAGVWVCRLRRWRIIAFSIIVILFILGAACAVPDVDDVNHLIERWGQTLFGIPNLETLGEEASWVGRVEIWRRAWRVIRDHPLTGIGFDAFFPVVHARYPMFFIPPGQNLTHAHNLYLQIALDLGLPGLAAFVGLMTAFGRMMFRVMCRSGIAAGRAALAMGLIFGVLAQLLYGLADAIALGQKPGAFLWAYLAVGAALYALSIPSSSTEVETKRRRIVQWLLKWTPIRSVRAGALSICVTVGMAGLVMGYVYICRTRTWIALLEADMAALTDMDLSVRPADMASSLRTMRADLLGFQSELALPLALAPYMGWLPVYGDDIETVPRLLQMGQQLLTVAEETEASLRPLLASDLSRAPNGREISSLLIALINARPQLETGLDRLADIRRTRQEIHTDRLSAPLIELVARFDRTCTLLEQALQGAIVLPDLMGASGRRTYLILIQNEDELRPTGGFLSGVAHLVVEEGRLVELTYQDSYALDDLSQPYPLAPTPLCELMGTELWFFRDSNWSPDFPTTAQVALALYQLRYGTEATVDGIIAVDQQVLRDLVSAFQPVEVPTYPEPITGENVIQAVRTSWAPSSPEGLTQTWWERRKDFMGHLVAAMARKWQTNPDRIDMPGLGLAMLRALEERHMFIHMLADPPVADLFHRLGWDGALVNAPGDYWMIVDANVGFNKVNPYIVERLAYTVDLRNPLRPLGTLTITHQHRGTASGVPCRHESRYDLTYAQMMQRCYWDYVRIYTPPGSELLEATRHPVAGSLLLRGMDRPGDAEVLWSESERWGKSAWATFFVLAPGERTQTRFRYTLSPTVVERMGELRQYRLYMQKQGGTAGHPVTVIILMPTDAAVTGATPPPAYHAGEVWRYTFDLRTDREIMIEWLQDD